MIFGEYGELLTNYINDVFPVRIKILDLYMEHNYACRHTQNQLHINVNSDL